MTERDSVVQFPPPSFGHRRYVVASRAIPYAMVAFSQPMSLNQAAAEAAIREEVAGPEAKIGVFELRFVRESERG